MSSHCPHLTHLMSSSHVTLSCYILIESRVHRWAGALIDRSFFFFFWFGNGSDWARGNYWQSRRKRWEQGHQVGISLVSHMEFGPQLLIQSCKPSGVAVSRGLLAPRVVLLAGRRRCCGSRVSSPSCSTVRCLSV